MNTNVWSTIVDFHRATWTSVSANDMAPLLADDVEMWYNGGSEHVRGKDAVLQWYRVSYFSTVVPHATTLFNFRMESVGRSRVHVSYALVQSHSDERGPCVGNVIILYDVHPQSSLITCISMTFDGEHCCCCDLKRS